ncbi:hypothetical protein DN33_3675 [Vibrio cholerae]|nr:hypothetical protein DN33_3675 [Vibrio cholerae]
MVSVVVFEFIGMRCQPLRRALCAEYWVHIHALMKNSDHPDLLAAGLLIKDDVTPLGKFSVSLSDFIA